MAQTTGAMTGATATLELNVNNGGFTDIAGSASSIDVVEMTRLNGSAFTLDGDYAVLTFGRQPPTAVTVNILYTEVAGEAFLKAVSALKANQLAQIRWKPAGSGGASFTTVSGGKISTVSLPGNDASSGDPLMVSFVVQAPGIETSIS
jgi:hypothetical protein